MTKYWDQVWENIGERQIYAPQYRLLRLDDYRGRSVVELGCGNLSFSQDIVRESKSYIGVDISDEALKQARSNNDLGDKVRLLRCNMTSIELDGKSAESVIAIDTMSTMGPDFGMALLQASQIMAPKAVINFNLTHTDWFLAGPMDPQVSIYTQGHGQVFKFDEPVEVITFRPEGIERELREVGLEPSEIRVLASKEVIELLPYSAAARVLMMEEHPDVPMSMMIRAVKA